MGLLEEDQISKCLVQSLIIEILIGGHNVDYYSAEIEIAGEPNKLVS